MRDVEGVAARQLGDDADAAELGRIHADSRRKRAKASRLPPVPATGESKTPSGARPRAAMPLGAPVDRPRPDLVVAQDPPLADGAAAGLELRLDHRQQEPPGQ